MRIAVVGTGISGLLSARLLHHAGHDRIRRRDKLAFLYRLLGGPEAHLSHFLPFRISGRPHTNTGDFQNGLPQFRAT